MQVNGNLGNIQLECRNETKLLRLAEQLVQSKYTLGIHIAVKVYMVLFAGNVLFIVVIFIVGHCRVFGCLYYTIYISFF